MFRIENWEGIVSRKKKKVVRILLPVPVFLFGAAVLCRVVWSAHVSYREKAIAKAELNAVTYGSQMVGQLKTGVAITDTLLRASFPKGKLISPGLLKIRGIAFIFFSNYPFTDPAVTPLMMKRDRKMYTARTGRMASKMNIYTLPKSNLE